MVRGNENLVKRAEVLRAIRRFFDEQGFVEVDTPLMVRSPGIEEHIEAFAVRTTPERFLITSPEFQLKRLLAQGMHKIYQLGHCFRDDEQGGHHEPEFLMLEWYRANETYDAVMRDTESLVATLAAQTRSLRDGQSTLGGARVDAPWLRTRIDDAFRLYSTVDEGAPEDDDTFFRRYVEDVEPQLGREQATFITHWPARMASLARLAPDDPSLAERFEGYVAGIELCNGFSELTDPVEQRARFEETNRKRAARGAPTYPIDQRFLSCLPDMPPAAGNALGVDRLIMLLLDAPDIQSVIAFPNSTL